MIWDFQWDQIFKIFESLIWTGPPHCNLFNPHRLHSSNGNKNSFSRTYMKQFKVPMYPVDHLNRNLSTEYSIYFPGSLIFHRCNHVIMTIDICNVPDTLCSVALLLLERRHFENVHNLDPSRASILANTSSALREYLLYEHTVCSYLLLHIF